MRVFAQCNQLQCSSQKTFTKKSRGLISAVIIKGNKSEEKAIYFSEKIRTYQGNSILVLPLLKSQIMHAEEFVLIPKRMFVSKNLPKEEIIDNPIYQQKATQLSLLQRSDPNFEQSSGKKLQDADTSPERLIMRIRSISDGTSDPDDVKSESFVSDDSEIEMLELKLMNENKTKRASIILKKIFVSDTVSISEENNVLHIEDEPQGVKVIDFLYNLQQANKKIDVQKSRIWFTILMQKMFSMSFTAKKRKNNRLEKNRNSNQEEDLTRKKVQNQKLTRAKRRQTKTREEKTGLSIDDVKKLDNLYLK